MDKRSTIVLAAIAIGLFAYIVLYERYTITSGELAEVEGQLIERFVRARVNRLVIERPDAPTVEITRDREEQDLLGVWRLERPVEALADSDAVSSLLGAVQYAAARRTLESPSSDELAGFGLAEPRLTATFEVADERIVLRFGSEDPTESGVYMQVGERVHVVGKDLYEALDHPPGHFRSKRLLEEGVVMSESLALTGEGGERRLRKRDARHWDVEVAGGMALASIALVEEALQAFSDLEAESFAPEGEEVDAGLEAPWLRAEALRPTGDDGEGEERVVLKVGAPCGERGEERWARVSVEGEPGPLGCVLTSRLDALTRPLADFREARPITMRDLELQSASLANGAVTLGVAQEQGVWRWTRTERGREESGEVDDQALADWLTEIRRARATLFASAENLAAYGLEAPRATLRVVDQEGIEEQVAVGAVSAEGLYLRRGDEPQILVVPAEAEALFTPSAARLRPRQLWEHPQRAVTRLDLTRGGTRERIEKREGRWTITEPLAVEVDRERVLELARMVARLEAERFVADGPAPEHGLDAPRLELGVRIEPEEGEPIERQVRIGAETEGGAFAQLAGDEAVFVAPATLVARIERPFVSDQVLATDVIFVDGITVSGEGREVEIRHDGRVFSTDDGPLEQALSERLADAIERLRVRPGAYGAASAAEGFDPPRLRIAVRRGAQAEAPLRYTILVGAPTGEGEDAHVRREDLAVGLLAEESDLQPWFDLLRR